MKPALLALLFFIAGSVGSHAGEWFGLSYFVEFGYNPTGTFVMYDENQIRDRAYVNDDMYADFDATMWLFTHFYVGGNVRTGFWKMADGYDFMPNQMTYGFRAGLDFKNLEIGFRHYCIHPIYVYLTRTEFENNYDPLWEGSYEEIFVRIKGGIGSAAPPPR
jgi:hypothetical protein